MADPASLFLVTLAPMQRLVPHSPLSHAIPRVDDRHVLSGIISILRYGLRWRDSTSRYSPHKRLCRGVVRSSCMGMVDRICVALAAASGPPDRLMIDATHLMANRTASRLKECRLPAFSAAWHVRTVTTDVGHASVRQASSAWRSIVCGARATLALDALA